MLLHAHTLQIRRDRDREIEMVIARLEEETASSMQESEKQLEHRVRRLREKFDLQLRELETSEKGAVAKY